jgi:hypothetical protein
MKRLLPLFLLALTANVYAGPTLYAAPYLSTSVQPTTVGLTLNGTPAPASVTCTLPKNAAGDVTPTCDLTSLAPGSYTIVMMVSANANCPNPTSPATCTGGGAASSAPFVLNLLPGLATSPTLRVAP